MYRTYVNTSRSWKIIKRDSLSMLLSNDFTLIIFQIIRYLFCTHAYCPLMPGVPTEKNAAYVWNCKCTYVGYILKYVWNTVGTYDSPLQRNFRTYVSTCLLSIFQKKYVLTFFVCFIRQYCKLDLHRNGNGVSYLNALRRVFLYTTVWRHNRWRHDRWGGVMVFHTFICI